MQADGERIASPPDVAPVAVPPIPPPRRHRVGMSTSASLTGLFILALLYGAHIAADVVVPVAVAVLLALLLSPPLRVLTRLGIPTPVAAGLVVALFLAVIGTAFYMLSGPAAAWLEEMPRNIDKLDRKLDSLKGSFKEVQQATQQVEALATLEASEREGRAVEIRRPSALQLALESTPAVLVSIAATFVLLYFILASGKEIIRKMSSARRRSQWSRRRVIGIIRAVEEDMSRYLVTVSLINGGLGLATGIMLFLFGIPNATLWGVVVALLNYAPYIGATISTGIITLLGLITFDTLGKGIMPAVVFMCFAFLEGQLLSPSIVGRRLRLSPLLVFLAVVFGAWMWGPVGALIAVPMLACTKIVCKHVPEWSHVAELIRR